MTNGEKALDIIQGLEIKNSLEISRKHQRNDLCVCVTGSHFPGYIQQARAAANFCRGSIGQIDGGGCNLLLMCQGPTPNALHSKAILNGLSLFRSGLRILGKLHNYGWSF